MFANTHVSIVPSSRRRLAGALLAVLAVAALLVTVQARPAGAAPPVLTASENPVVVPFGSTSKSITLGWNLNGYPKASLSVQENGGPVVASFAVGFQTGSLPLTATYGKSYTATLIDPVANGPLASLQITTKRPFVNPPSPTPTPTPDLDDGIRLCILKPCITNVSFMPHGTYSEFTVKTTKAAGFQMLACATPVQPNGGCSLPVSGVFNIGYVNAWSSHLGGLQPDTTYYYVLKAEDQQGNEALKSGSFTTLKRKVEVTFAQIEMTDDSDDLSACECAFWFKAGSEPTQSLGQRFSLSTGESLEIDVRFTLTDAPADLPLRVKGRDDDTRWGGHVCDDSSYSPDAWTDGSNSCADWSSAQRSIDVDVPGFGEEFTDSFVITAGGSPLRFKVFGTVKVTYVP